MYILKLIIRFGPIRIYHVDIVSPLSFTIIGFIGSVGPFRIFVIIGMGY